MTIERPSVKVAVEMERETAPNPYEAWRFRIRDVVPHEEAFGDAPRVLRDDGRVQKYHIVGEDEADPKAGSISFVSPVARSLMGKAVGDVVGTPGQELEIISIS